jgi:hypothetical protein
MPKYNVCITADFYDVVDAPSEDEAHDIAETRFWNGELQIDSILDINSEQLIE